MVIKLRSETGTILLNYKDGPDKIAKTITQQSRWDLKSVQYCLTSRTAATKNRKKKKVLYRRFYFWRLPWFVYLCNTDLANYSSKQKSGSLCSASWSTACWVCRSKHAV